jgi:hypothetical protein
VGEILIDVFGGKTLPSMPDEGMVKTNESGAKACASPNGLSAGMKCDEGRHEVSCFVDSLPAYAWHFFNFPG